MKKKQLAILVSSYDGAAELWKPLEQSYNKFWPDNPFKVYLATNHMTPLLDDFNVLPIGKEKSWSDNILKCLDRIDEDYILLTFDDIFPCKKIDTELINRYIDKAIVNNWDYLRLHPSPLPDEDVDSDVGVIFKDRHYRASTVWAIFRKDIFKDLLKDTETAWEFERNGSLRSNKYHNFYASKRTVIPFLNAVVKGKWIPEVFETLKKMDLDVKVGNITLMTKREVFIEKMKRLRMKFFLKVIPKAIQVQIRHLFDNSL